MPRRAPFDMFESIRRSANLTLLVRRVLILDDYDELLLEWLSFIIGIVGSEDFPLSISQETLQQNKLLHEIKKFLVVKSLDMFAEITTMSVGYRNFYVRVLRRFVQHSGTAVENKTADDLLPVNVQDLALQPSQCGSLCECLNMHHQFFWMQVQMAHMPMNISTLMFK